MSAITTYTYLNTTGDSTTSPALAYIARLPSAGSRRIMRTALRNILALILDAAPSDVTWTEVVNFDWSLLTAAYTPAITARIIGNEWAPATINRHIGALRGVLKECWRLGMMDSDTYARAADIRQVKATTLPSGRDLDVFELRQLLLDCMDEATPINVRDAAIIGVLYSCGLRREELAAIDMADYTPKTGRLLIPEGKGHKQRVVYVTNK
ncbi:MAG: tyrosine-type recombinase/integrase, partial [Anaerolineae bacterium]|nr:tyrosine-type recombinase/integrase [Anaerolineae bacterium]